MVVSVCAPRLWGSTYSLLLLAEDRHGHRGHEQQTLSLGLEELRAREVRYHYGLSKLLPTSICVKLTHPYVTQHDLPTNNSYSSNYPQNTRLDN